MSRSIRLRAGTLGVAVFGSVAAWAPAGAASAQPQHARPNPVVIENRHPGSTGWTLPWPGFTVADDISLQIKGYPGQESTAPGGSVDLKVTTTPAQTFNVDVFRLGFYQGLGGRLMEHLGPFNGVQQPPCGIDTTTRMNFCSWSTSVSLQVPTTWISGVYVAVLSSAANYQSLIPFWVVEENQHSDLLYISSLNTYEAYNNFPYDPPPTDPQGIPQTGHSLYDFNSAGTMPAVKVTFDRPFNSQYGGPGDGGLYDFEPELIHFIEKSGYWVTYANEPVIDAKPWLLRAHKAVVIGGHAEYQTMANYNGLIAARDHGVGLAFISGNEIYWQVRYEPDAAGMARRVVVGYKTTAPDPTPDPRLRTINWRDLGRPEQKLIGVQLPTSGYMNWGGQRWVPQNASYWPFAGTGFSNGDPIYGEISGYEIDSYDPTVGKPAGTDYTLLSASPFTNYLGQPFTQNSSIYKGLGGNWVWATGSMDWSWTLAPGGQNAAHNNVRSGMQKITRNILDRMIADAPSRT